MIKKSGYLEGFKKFRVSDGNKKGPLEGALCFVPLFIMRLY